MKATAAMLIGLLAVTAAAQPVEGTETLLGNGEANLGFFIHPFCDLGYGGGAISVFPGIASGVTLNDSLALSISYRMVASENTPSGVTDNRYYLDQQYAGVKLEYFLFPREILHLGIQVEAGMGHAELDPKDSYEFELASGSRADASFAFIEPGLGIRINVWKYLKLDLSASYRFTSAVSFAGIAESGFRGLNGSAGVKLGLF